jgi:hypothetical protein
VQHPQLINQTIDRYNFMLNDQESPLISNFLNLLDYHDGRNMPSYEEFRNGQKDKKYEHLLDKYVR